MVLVSEKMPVSAIVLAVETNMSCLFSKVLKANGHLCDTFITNVFLNRPKVRSQRRKTILFGNFSQHGGGGAFPNPKAFVNLPSIFLYAKFILRC